jgi:hypothetical protein
LDLPLVRVENATVEAIARIGRALFLDLGQVFPKELLLRLNLCAALVLVVLA